MPPETPNRNFIITVIAITFALMAAIPYILLNIEPNIYWEIGFIFLCWVVSTLVFSLIFYGFGSLQSFETPRQMYRRQMKKAVVLGLVVVALLLVQKFFNLL